MVTWTRRAVSLPILGKRCSVGSDFRAFYVIGSAFSAAVVLFYIVVVPQVIAANYFFSLPSFHICSPSPLSDETTWRKYFDGQPATVGVCRILDNFLECSGLLVITSDPMMIFIGYPVLAVVTLALLSAVVHCDPGLLPVSDPHEWYLDNLPDSQQPRINVPPHPKYGEHSYVKGRELDICHFCRTPVAGFDHHCGVIGACVGRKNYFYFFQMLLWGSIATGPSAVVSLGVALAPIAHSGTITIPMVWGVVLPFLLFSMAAGTAAMGITYLFLHVVCAMKGGPGFAPSIAERMCIFVKVAFVPVLPVRLAPCSPPSLA